MSSGLYVNFVNDHEDNSEYGSEYVTDNDSLISLEMHLIYWLFRRMMIYKTFSVVFLFVTVHISYIRQNCSV